MSRTLRHFLVWVFVLGATLPDVSLGMSRGDSESVAVAPCHKVAVPEKTASETPASEPASVPDCQMDHVGIDTETAAVPVPVLSVLYVVDGRYLGTAIAGINARSLVPTHGPPQYGADARPHNFQHTSTKVLQHYLI